MTSFEIQTTDRLARIETKLDAVIERTLDMEPRLASLEQSRWRFVGATTALSSVLVFLVSHFKEWLFK